MATKSVYRCAVYTRKSHEEGLDQDFNSLDAQSESCKAYIASQAGLGWSLRERAYDDGGISGGHMERPGLQALIRDIKAGLIDIIVVYKVDRLTRSLTDFAKLVDVFDEHDVSFVSVTQAFNTTTSMGRLTLNVLLSFAQFEREVTAERIRDKIAASKAKGMWMGGTVPLGYRNKDRKLYIDEDEASVIKEVFKLYLEHKNVRRVKQQADALGLITRRRTHKSGKRTGGQPFSRGHIYRILTNPIYIGKIQHREKVYAGSHEAIINKSLWSDVQDALKANAVKRSVVGNSKSAALLAGLLQDADDNKLVPHHANKKGTRYHYYVSQRLKTGDQDSGWRIPAKTIEGVVIETLKATLNSGSNVLDLLPLNNRSAEGLQSITAKSKQFSDEIRQVPHDQLKTILNDLIEVITLKTDQLAISFKTQGLAARLGIKLPDEESIILTKPMTIRRRGQEMKMIIGGEGPKASNSDSALINLIAQAHLLKTELESGVIDSIKSFAAKYGTDHGNAKNLLRASYIAPAIIEDILAGHQPFDLTARRLKYMSNLPINWADQRKYLGFH